MTERYTLIDKVAGLVSRWVPEKEPNYYNMDDNDFITVLSWCEKWHPKKVYYTAYKESHIDFIQTWDEWEKDPQRLPIAVRAELTRAVKLHHAAGNLGALRTYAFLYEYHRKAILWSCAIAFIAWYWLT